MYYRKSHVLDLFAVLANAGIPWILPWTILSTLPSKVPYGKDIDLLTQDDHEPLLGLYLRSHGFTQIPHPYRDQVHLYGTKPPLRFLSPTKLPIDISSKVTVRSLDAGQWIPIHQTLHDSIWTSAYTAKIESTEIMVPCNEDLLVCMICRSIFNKHSFSDDTISYIQQTLPSASYDQMLSKLELVFYSFAPYLLHQIKASRFDSILSTYYAFSTY